MITRHFPLSFILYPLSFILVFGCSSVPPGTTVGVTGDSQSNITSSVTVPITTNLDLSATVTGNPVTGDVSGGIWITFKTDPTHATTAALLDAGVLQSKTARAWLLPKWDPNSKPQQRALELALREGATLTRPAKALPITKTLKPNAKLKVGLITYWNITAFPCSSPFLKPTQIAPRLWAVPTGTWPNPGATNPRLTLICK
jgi:hypothetical protein